MERLTTAETNAMCCESPLINLVNYHFAPGESTLYKEIALGCKKLYLALEIGYLLSSEATASFTLTVTIMYFCNACCYYRNILALYISVIQGGERCLC